MHKLWETFGECPLERRKWNWENRIEVNVREISSEDEKCINTLIVCNARILYYQSSSLIFFFASFTNFCIFI